MEPISIKSEIEKLKHGESYTVPESDYGKAEIWMINELYFLFSIPQYGGIPAFENKYRTYDIDELIQVIESWT